MRCERLANIIVDVNRSPYMDEVVNGHIRILMALKKVEFVFASFLPQGFKVELGDEKTNVYEMMLTYFSNFKPLSNSEPVPMMARLKKPATGIRYVRFVFPKGTFAKKSATLTEEIMKGPMKDASVATKRADLSNLACSIISDAISWWLPRFDEHRLVRYYTKKSMTNKQGPMSMVIAHFILRIASI